MKLLLWTLTLSPVGLLPIGGYFYGDVTLNDWKFLIMLAVIGMLISFLLSIVFAIATATKLGFDI